MNQIFLKDIEMILENISSISESFRNSRVLIVGGKGFLGTYFVNILKHMSKTLDNSIDIIVMDNLITAKDRNEFDDKNIKFIEQDISIPFSLDGEIDYIIHSASIASPPTYRKFPIKTVDVNYQGTRNLLDIAKEKKTKAMLFLSSSEIYGDPTVIPTPETYWGNVSSVGPRACYDESKRLAETISILYYQQFKIPVKIARPFNVYGPFLNLDDGRMIPDFMKNAINDSKIIIHSDGSPTRSFCYVTDAISAFFKILVLASPGSIFNVGNDEEVSVIQVAEKIKKIVKNSIEIKLEKSSDQNYTIDNPKRRCPDLTKIKALGYQPKIKLDEGLQRIYEWYLGN